MPWTRRPKWVTAPALIAVNLLLTFTSSAAPPRFEWKDGDRVVLIGDTFVEREQTHGYLEAFVAARNPGRSLTFRNLGWSADTVSGLSRSGFGKADEGFRQLKEHVVALKPTVLIVGYGMAASFDGAAGVPGFVSSLNATLDAVATPETRLVFLSPIAHEDLGRPLPDPAKHNADLALYRDAVKKLAEDRKGWFVDLYEPTLSAHDYGIDPLTDNGIHPTAFGYWYFASVIDQELRQSRRELGWNVMLDARGGRARGNGTQVKNVEPSNGGVKFETLDSAVPAPPPPPGSPEAVWGGGRRTVRVGGLEPGNYVLTVDGKPAASGSDDLWSKGVPEVNGPEVAQAEALRQAVVAKNRLYFYRWRPQNETYLFGFRKHEQGNNAREIPLFDPLVQTQEKEILRLSRPVPHQYELKREGEVAR
ncbi:MAG: SGNH/GDSL hydrolase family protein [Isosphaeraceae bacterium]